MNARTFVIFAIAVSATGAVRPSVTMAHPADADPAATAGQAGQERKMVRLRTLSPGDTLYVLLGGGGNSLALIGEDGVVLIDTKSPGWGQAIADAVEAVTERPVRTIINTHAHLDHTDRK